MPFSISRIVRRVNKSFAHTQEVKPVRPQSKKHFEALCADARSQDHSLLSKLPAELRVAIYELVFEPYLSAEFCRPVSEVHSRNEDLPRLWSQQSEAIRPCIRMTTALLRTCKLIYHEAAQTVFANANRVHRLEVWILPRSTARTAEEMAWRTVPVLHPDMWNINSILTMKHGPPEPQSELEPALAVSPPHSGESRSGEVEDEHPRRVNRTRHVNGSFHMLLTDNQAIDEYPQTVPELAIMQCQTLRMDLVSFNLAGCLSFSGRFPPIQPSILFRDYAKVVRRLVFEVCFSKHGENATQQSHYTEEFVEAFHPCASPMRLCDSMDKVNELVLEVWRRVDGAVALKDMPELGWQIETSTGSRFHRVPGLDEKDHIQSKGRAPSSDLDDLGQLFRVDRVVWQLK